MTVEYELTQSGESFKTVLESMIEWGLQHSELTLHTKQPD
ncbi:winged helix-turn-helix transcriptional regulator [Sphingobacterium sp.]